MKKEISTTVEAVREAALTCPQAKQTLKVLFPSAFKEDTEPERGEVWRIPNWGTYMVVITEKDQYILVNVNGGTLQSSPRTKSALIMFLKKEKAKRVATAIQAKNVMTNLFGS